MQNFRPGVVLTSYVIAAIALLAILQLGLLAVLLAGLAVWEIGDLAVPTLKRVGIAHQGGRAVAAAMIAAIVASLIVVALLALAPLLSNHTESFAALFSKMADVVASLKVHLPDWAANYIPVERGGPSGNGREAPARTRDLCPGGRVRT